MMKLFQAIKHCAKVLNVVECNFVQQCNYMKSGTFYPKLPLNFINGENVEVLEELDNFAIEEPATGLSLIIM